ncbi:hypothetical protein PAXRUDRAFT_836217 [Paxillus rubicundulus Ve08.2h10]|uniref:Uncharacterized protein n=1 Tax=Paxillus rubicundulus Ve08.2h10 TaxID=930991 RepID=A0A0D0BQ36_9AGAM|nr:hypothetical protein PAXRUDRAFT_836217 [Paxillus rubicundulus Ve08.2h10]
MSLPFPSFNLPYWTIGQLWCIVTLLIAALNLQGHPAGSGMLVIWGTATFVLSICCLMNSVLTETIEIHGHAKWTLPQYQFHIFCSTFYSCIYHTFFFFK